MRLIKAFLIYAIQPITKERLHLIKVLSTNEFSRLNLSCENPLAAKQTNILWIFTIRQKRKRRQKEVRRKMDHLCETLSLLRIFCAPANEHKAMFNEKSSQQTLFARHHSPSAFTERLHYIYRKIPKSKHRWNALNAPEECPKLHINSARIFSRTSQHLSTWLIHIRKCDYTSDQPHFVCAKCVKLRKRVPQKLMSSRRAGQTKRRCRIQNICFRTHLNVFLMLPNALKWDFKWDLNVLNVLNLLYISSWNKYLRI